MAKVQEKPLGEAYKGTLSTFLVTLMILGIGFFLPQITANRLEDARRGETTWTPRITYEEYVIWSTESNADFNPPKIDHLTDDGASNSRFEWGSRLHAQTSSWDNDNVPHKNYWIYRTIIPNTQHRRKNVYNEISYSYTDTEFPDSDKVYGNYMVGNLNPDVRYQNKLLPHSVGKSSIYDAHNGHYREELAYYCILDFNDWENYEATKLSFFIQFESDLAYVRYLIDGISINTGSTYLLDKGISRVAQSPFTLFVEFDITLDDIISLSTLNSQGKLSLRFRFISTDSNGNAYPNPRFYSNTNVIFDTTVRGLLSIEEEKPTAWISTMTKYSIYMVLESILIFVLGLVMLPQLSIGRLAEILGLVKKK